MVSKVGNVGLKLVSLDLLITAYGSFDDEHKLVHTKKISAHTSFQKQRLFFGLILESQTIFSSYL